MKSAKKVHKSTYIIIILMYLFYSMIGIIGKYNAVTSTTWSIRFIVLLGVQLAGLMIFTVAWQFMLKKFDLSFVYLFKGTTILWGLFFAFIVFHEQISVTNLIGAVIIMIGIGVVVSE